MGKNCEKFLSELSAYVDGEIDSELCSEIEAHIGNCENCRIMVDTLKKTVKLCRDGKCEELPEKLDKKLNNLLRQKWEKKFSGNA